MAGYNKTPAAPVAPAAPKGEKAGPALVVCTVPGAERRCRAGLCFGMEPTVVPLAELSKEQVEAIQADPLLVVQEAK